MTKKDETSGKRVRDAIAHGTKLPKMSKFATPTLKRLYKQDTLTSLQVGRVLILNSFSEIAEDKPLGLSNDFGLLYTKVKGTMETLRLVYYRRISDIIMNIYNQVLLESEKALMNLAIIEIAQDDIIHNLKPERFQTSDKEKTHSLPYVYTSNKYMNTLYLSDVKEALESIQAYEAAVEGIKVIMKNDRRLNKFELPDTFDVLKSEASSFNTRIDVIEAKEYASVYDQFKTNDSLNLLEKIKIPKKVTYNKKLKNQLANCINDLINPAINLTQTANAVDHIIAVLNKVKRGNSIDQKKKKD